MGAGKIKSMLAGNENVGGISRVRWFHLLILIGLMLLGSWMRWYRIDRESLALDEYWALYLSTGRGAELFQIPYGVIVESPPAVGFAGAASWPHIWTGLGTVTHPPVYYLLLRWCVDFFGEGDKASRTMSLMFGVAASGLLFDAVRRTAGAWRGLAAAGIMLFAQAQIDSSQAARPYALLEFLGVGLCDVLIAFQRRSPSFVKPVALGVITAVIALTHYFAAGAILGCGAFAVIGLRGRVRKAAISAMLWGLLAALVVWGPVLWKTRHVYEVYEDYYRDPNRATVRIAWDIALIPIRVLLDPTDRWRWFSAIPLAVFVYVIPPLRVKKSPDVLIWWLMAVGAIAVVAAVDLVRQSLLVGELRYVLLAGPAIYAMLVILPRGSLGGAVVGVFFMCAAVYGAARIQTGPDLQEDWKTMAKLIDKVAGPHDAVALVGYYPNEPAFDYFVVAHYLGDWHRPVMLVMDPPDERARNELASQQHAWMVGHSARFDTGRLLPGWGVGPSRGIGKRNAIWMLLPPSSKAGAK